MYLESIETTKSPEFPGFTRITARIVRNQFPPLEVWFEIEDALRGDITRSSTPWILAMLPYALESGENIETSIPSDAYFVENLRGIIATWRKWYPRLKAIEIRCPVTMNNSPTGKTRRKAAFFSGGIDSWFSALRHCPEREPSSIGCIDDLISVHGFDISLDNLAAFDALTVKLRRGADVLGKSLCIVRTNLRQENSLWGPTGWGGLTHGAGLAAVGHLLDGRLSQVIIGSTHTYENLIPWGSHPMIDPMFSSSHLMVMHDGAMFNRVEKSTLVARHPDALALLHVCWKNGDERNCGTCSKCLRTMATLKLLDVSGIDAIFDTSFSVNRLARNFISDINDEKFMSEVRSLAESIGRADILNALDRSLKFSRRIRPFIRASKGLRYIPYFRRFETSIRKLFLRAL